MRNSFSTYKLLVFHHSGMRDTMQAKPIWQALRTKEARSVAGPLLCSLHHASLISLVSSRNRDSGTTILEKLRQRRKEAEA